MTKTLYNTDLLGCPPTCPSYEVCRTNRKAPLGCLRFAEIQRSKHQPYAVYPPPAHSTGVNAVMDWLTASVIMALVIVGISTLASLL
jgi:hypothetical protein